MSDVSQIGVIEDAMLKAVRDAAAGLAYKIKFVESYGGQLDEGLDELVRSFPAVWVTYGGSAKPEKLGAEKFRVPVTMITLVGARNIRGERATRQGSATEVGTYQMLKDVHDLMVLQDFGLPISRLEPGRIQTLFSTTLEKKAVSVFSQEWHTAFVTRKPQPEDSEWRTIGMQFLLKPGDETADVSADLTLRDP